MDVLLRAGEYSYQLLIDATPLQRQLSVATASDGCRTPTGTAHAQNGRLSSRRDSRGSPSMRHSPGGIKRSDSFLKRAAERRAALGVQSCFHIIAVRGCDGEPIVTFADNKDVGVRVLASEGSAAAAGIRPGEVVLAIGGYDVCGHRVAAQQVDIFRGEELCEWRVWGLRPSVVVRLRGERDRAQSPLPGGSPSMRRCAHATRAARCGVLACPLRAVPACPL